MGVEVKESGDQAQPSVSAEPPDTISEQDAPSDSDSAALASASETNVSEAAEVEIASTPETSEVQWQQKKLILRDQKQTMCLQPRITWTWPKWTWKPSYPPQTILLRLSLKVELFQVQL